MSRNCCQSGKINIASTLLLHTFDILSAPPTPNSWLRLWKRGSLILKRDFINTENVETVENGLIVRAMLPLSCLQ